MENNQEEFRRWCKNKTTKRLFLELDRLESAYKARLAGTVIDAGNMGNCNVAVGVLRLIRELKDERLLFKGMFPKGGDDGDGI